MSYSILISVKIGGKYSSKRSLDNLITSIETNIFTKNYLILFFIEDSINLDALIYLRNLKKNNLEKKFFKKISWYNWYKDSFKISKNFNYIYLIHDDVTFVTKNFDLKIYQQTRSIPNLGCIALRDPSYLLGIYKTQFRKGFYIDRFYKKSGLSANILEFKNQKPFWYLNNIKLKKFLFFLKLDKTRLMENFKTAFLEVNKLDFPKQIVKCHASYNDLICLETKNIKYLNNICNFDVAHGLNADEDLGLECLKIGLNNIFIPNVYYNHDMPLLGNASRNIIIKEREKCNKIFENKWGFSLINDNFTTRDMLDTLKKIEAIYGNKLTWTKNFQSYDWQYV
jgi:hypothetical protein